MKAKGVLGVFLAWVVICIIFGVLLHVYSDHSFLTPGNFELMMRQAVIVGLGAIGMAYVIMTGGIDLSPGSTIALTTVVVAIALKATNNPFIGIGVSILCGLIAGFINGLLVAKLKVGPFIVTLATMLIFRGVAKGFSHEQTVSSVPDTWIHMFTAALGKTEKWQVIPKGGWVWIALLIVMTWVLHRTVFGRNVVAVGSNEKTARLCGINISRVKIGVYTIGGLFAGIAGLMQVSRVGIGDPTIAVGEELKMIAAVVIGGGSLLGGEGNMLGAAIGTLIMTTINMGCSQLGIDNWIQEIITGTIIVVAVALDRYRMSRPAKVAPEPA
ncbi:MAG: ABC transporter permease [Armatimonadetes bacterium]|nr:ABC transporter permease [Armatimonadota bacterium]MBS1703453.1 ABC transporter permease [Armatimonadota bacterium]MBS1727536.1 ABC transporter permease [Armatimonadota bacterium]